MDMFVCERVLTVSEAGSRKNVDVAAYAHLAVNYFH